MYNRYQTQPSTVDLKIPELEEDSDQYQFADLDTFIMHHNTHQENKWKQSFDTIHQSHHTTGQHAAKKCQDHRK